MCKERSTFDGTSITETDLSFTRGRSGNRTRAIEVLQTPAFPLRHPATPLFYHLADKWPSYLLPLVSHSS